MGTIFDYLDWRGDLTIDQAPFSEADALFFSLVSYIDYEGIVSGKTGGKTIALGEAANTYFAQRPERDKISLGVLVPKEIVTLLDKARTTPRFCKIRMGGYINRVADEENTQFCAMTFFLPTGEIVASFRGTDDSIVGWRENCEMSFTACVPAQKSAAKYLDDLAKAYPTAKIIVTGHSKGGNLASYATLHCSDRTREKILLTYNLDGQGSQMEDWYEDDAFLEKRKLIKTFVPEHSIVGLLLKHDPNFVSIKSDQMGILQHNGLSWQILGGSFLRVEGAAKDALRSVGRLNAWVNGMTEDERKEVVKAIFSIFEVSKAHTLTELVAQKGQWIPKCRELDPSVFTKLESVFAALLMPPKKKDPKSLLGELFKM